MEEWIFDHGKLLIVGISLFCVIFFSVAMYYNFKALNEYSIKKNENENNCYISYINP